MRRAASALAFALAAFVGAGLAWASPAAAQAASAEPPEEAAELSEEASEVEGEQPPSDILSNSEEDSSAAEESEPSSVLRPDPEGDSAPVEAPTEALEEAPEEDRSGTIPSWTPGWVLAGVGLAALLAGAVTGGQALRDRVELDHLCGPEGACPPGSGFASLRDEGAALALATDVLVVSGAAIGLTGFLLALLLADPEPEQTEPAETGPGDPGSVEAGLACGPTGCLATLGGRLP